MMPIMYHLIFTMLLASSIALSMEPSMPLSLTQEKKALFDSFQKQMQHENEKELFNNALKYFHAILVQSPHEDFYDDISTHIEQRLANQKDQITQLIAETTQLRRIIHTTPFINQKQETCGCLRAYLEALMGRLSEVKEWEFIRCTFNQIRCERSYNATLELEESLLKAKKSVAKTSQTAQIMSAHAAPKSVEESSPSNMEIIEQPKESYLAWLTREVAYRRSILNPFSAAQIQLSIMNISEPTDGPKVTETFI